jgi:ketosteroid isomerase-like protein
MTNQINDELAALAANERFYRALEAADLAVMEAVWLHEDWVKCTHPGWELLTGWEAVRASWAQIFASKSRLRVAATDIRVTLEGDYASISGLEQLAIFTDDTGAPQSATANAANLFQRVAGEWRMIHHHASLMGETAMMPDEGEQ